MDKKTAAKAVKILLETVVDKIKEATRLSGSITSDDSWQAFDQACYEADFYINEALLCTPDESPEVEGKLYSSLKQIAALRIKAWEDWQMLWREQQAIADPTGKYGVMRVERDFVAMAMKDDDGNDGNGYHSPKR